VGLIQKIQSFLKGNRNKSVASVTTDYPSAQIIPRAEHQLSRKHISRHALNVLYRLHENGFEAYLVGGGVRDTLLELRPKDFDVATNALPEQVYQLFRNCRLIGRRFRLAHVFFGRDIIEVATFRASSQAIEEDEDDNNHNHNALLHADSGMIMRDNIYGTLIEDAWRRDFTVNALYYSIKDYSIVDHVNGISDLKQRILRMIGDPMTRYREDPVRMLRAVRLASKLGFTIEEETQAPLFQQSHLLKNVPPARLFEEVVKLFLSGHGTVTFEQLVHYNLFGALFPATATHLSDPQFHKLLLLALRNTDKRISEDKPVTPAFLLAIFLWPAYIDEKARLQEQDMIPVEAHHQALATVLKQQSAFVAIPRRFAEVIRAIWELQLPLHSPKRRQIFHLISNQRFRAAFDFLELRAQSGDNSVKSAATWWSDFQAADETLRGQMINKLSQGKKRSRSKSKPKNKKATDDSGSSDEQSQSDH